MAGFSRRMAMRGATDGYRIAGISATDEHGRVFTLNYRKVFATVSAVLLGIFCVYTAVHYLSAFNSDGHPLRVGSEQSKADFDATHNTGLMGGIKRGFQSSHIYIRKGQHVQMDYEMRKGAAIEVRVIPCQSRLIEEVFRCVPDGLQTLTVSGKTRGAEQLFFAGNRFYNIEHTIILPAKIDTLTLDTKAQPPALKGKKPQKTAPIANNANAVPTTAIVRWRRGT